MIRKFFVYLLTSLNSAGVVPSFPRKVVFFLCYSLLLSPLHARAENCAAIDYNITTIATGGPFTLGLKEDGTVVGVGNNAGGWIDVSSWTGIKSIAAGSYGLREDGTVVAVGPNGYGEKNVSSWVGIKSIAVGGAHTAGLKEDGTVVAVGRNWYGETNVSSWTGIKAIAAGTYHTVGLREDGTVVAVGYTYNGYGETKVSSWTGIKAIAAGYHYTVGLKEDGTVVAVGGNWVGQTNVSSWTGIKAISAGRNLYPHTVGLKEDGTVVGTGDSGYGQLNFSSWIGITAIAAGSWHTVGLKEDGTVVGVGFNNWGQLNVSDWTNIRQPGCLDSLKSPSSLAAADTPCDNGSSINLTWTLSPDDGSNVTGYRVYSSTTSGGPYDLVGNVNAGVNNYTDMTAIIGTTYYYVVRATDGTNESANSNEASAVSIRNLPLPPTSVTALDTSYDLGGSIALTWAKSVDDGTGLNNVANYNIYRYSSANGNIAVLASVPAGTTGYVDNTTVDSDTYYYFIKSLDNSCNAESTASDVVSGQSTNNMTALPGFIETLPGISQEMINSTTSKVENAISSLDRGNETAAINTLNALLNEIEAQSGKKVDTATAEMLKTYIQNLTAYIQSN